MAFGESTTNKTQVNLWYNRFKKCRENTNNYTHPGRQNSSTSNENIEAVKKIIFDIVESLLQRLLMMFEYRLAYGKQFLQMS